MCTARCDTCHQVKDANKVRLVTVVGSPDLEPIHKCTRCIKRETKGNPRKGQAPTNPRAIYASHDGFRQRTVTLYPSFTPNLPL